MVRSRMPAVPASRVLLPTAALLSGGPFEPRRVELA
jgi:hypothetical protein